MSHSTPQLLFVLLITALLIDAITPTQLGLGKHCRRLGHRRLRAVDGSWPLECRHEDRGLPRVRVDHDLIALVTVGFGGVETSDVELNVKDTAQPP